MLRLALGGGRITLEGSKLALLGEITVQTRSWQAVMPARVALPPLGLLPSP